MYSLPGYRALITWLIIHWSQTDHALIMSISCTDHRTANALITWMIIHWSCDRSCSDHVAIMHWSSGWSYSAPETDHALITWLSCTAHVADHAMIT
ncbi:hypothetical protein AFAEFNGA_00643 [Mycoplasmopsis arginini]|nr:hypothetical protein [Mycoplasmopsis arginini]